MGVSHIGDPSESEEMLRVAAKHNVRPWLEERPMKDAGLANKRVQENKVRSLLFAPAAHSCRSATAASSSATSRSRLDV